jgi:hypothetical protein
MQIQLEIEGISSKFGTQFFLIYLILPAALDPGVYLAFERSRKIMFLGSGARPVLRTNNLTAICELNI